MCSEPGLYLFIVNSTFGIMSTLNMEASACALAVGKKATAPLNLSHPSRVVSIKNSLIARLSSAVHLSSRNW